MDRGSVNRIIQAVASTARSAKKVPADLDKDALHEALHGVSVRAAIMYAADKTPDAWDWREDRGVAEWLIGVRLPVIYERFFGMHAGASTPGHIDQPKPGGPYIRFVIAAFAEYGIENPRTGGPYTPGTIRAALTARGRKTARRKAKH